MNIRERLKKENEELYQALMVMYGLDEEIPPDQRTFAEDCPEFQRMKNLMENNKGVL